jgi:hypothetical protein
LNFFSAPAPAPAPLPAADTSRAATASRGDANVVEVTISWICKKFLEFKGIIKISRDLIAVWLSTKWNEAKERLFFLWGVMKTNFHRLKNLWSVTALQQLNLDGLKDARTNFGTRFFEVTRNGPECGVQWNETKKLFDEWTRAKKFPEEDKLFKDLEEQWRTWCVRTGEPVAKSEWDTSPSPATGVSAFKSLQRFLSPKSSFPNSCELMELNYLNAVLTKHEVQTPASPFCTCMHCLQPFWPSDFIFFRSWRSK